MAGNLDLKVSNATSRTSEYLSQKPTAGQTKPPLKILQTLSTVLQNAAEHESKSKKTLPRNMPTHDATNNMQSTQDARRPHTNKGLQCTQ